MKILTLTGTRPELIRLSLIIKKLDTLVNNILVYTNQNYNKNLSTIFFDELKIRKPNYYFNFEFNSFGEFFGKSVIEFDKILKKENPDKILILGDTNSGLLSIVSEKYNIPIYHMEAGNRCYDNRVPEEINRKIIDNVSTYNLPYTENSKENLIKEGFNKNKIFKTGNPIKEVINYFNDDIIKSNICKDLDLYDGNYIKDYVLVTAHRSENVDNDEILSNIINLLNKISEKYKVIFSVHPRTKNKLNNLKIEINNNILLSEPFGFFDFITLEKNSKIIITDSGTVQEEASILGKQCIIIRESTERHELIECGSSVLSGTSYENILNAFNILIKRYNKWNIPNDYDISNVSDTIINILIGK